MAEIERFCVRCKTQIPEKRVARGSCFCSGECRRQDKIERRRAKAEKYCRLCHRPLPHRRTAQSATRLSSVEIKACAPGAQLDGGPIAGVHCKETDRKNGSQIGQTHFSYLELASCDRGFGGYRL